MDDEIHSSIAFAIYAPFDKGAPGDIMVSKQD